MTQARTSLQLDKTKLSLFTVLGGAILVAFVIVVGASLWGQYRLANQIIDKEISNSVRQNHALLQTVLSGQLSLINSQLQMLSQQEELTTLSQDDELVRIEQELLKLIEHQNQANASDFIVIGDLNSQRCRSSNLPFDSSRFACKPLIQQFDSNLYDWHLVKYHAEDRPILILLTRVPLIASSGQVLSYIYGGVVLTGNFALINQAISSAPEQTRAVGIAYEEQIIASSATEDSAEQQALTLAATHPERLVKVDRNGIVAMSQRILLEPERELDLRLVSVVQTDGMVTLQHGMLQQTSNILILAIILAIMIVLLTLKLSLTPLDRLRTLAAQRRNSSLTPFNAGPIVEFQQLSHEVANMLTDLQTTERSLIEKRRLLELSHKQQQELIRRNRKLLHQLFNLQEQERKQLAQELHDELGQPLAVINTDSYLIKTAIAPDSKVYECAESIQHNAKEMSDVVYRRITSLRPMPLNDLGLVAAIRHMPALDNLANHGIDVITELPDDQSELPDYIAIHIYRIIQEGLTNVLKHSQADCVWIRLQIDKNLPQQRLTLEIIDNGIGFDQAQLDESEGYGLSGMVERVYAMGGILTLTPNSEHKGYIHIDISLVQSEKPYPAATQYEPNWQI